MNKDILTIDNKKIKIYDLSIDDIINLKDKVSFKKYAIIVDNYLYYRCENHISCTKEELEKLKILYNIFNSDERTTLRYIQKLYNYINDLSHMSKKNYSKKQEKIDINKISISKLISLYKTIYLAKYIGYVKKYLKNRIQQNIYLSDIEIDQIKSLVNILNEEEQIREDQIKQINSLITKLIIISKHNNKKNFIKRLSNINLLSLEELYIYLETIINYAYFFIDKKHIESVIIQFKHNKNYLDKIEVLLNKSTIPNLFKDLITELKEKYIHNSEHPNIKINYDYLEKELPLIENKNIITIDEFYSPDLDGAFSVEKKGDIYILEVYITDVPSFLLKNEDIMKEAYQRSTSMYKIENNSLLNIKDMLPKEISHEALSLKKGNNRNVITFTYHIDSKGNIIMKNISRNNIYINDNIVPKTAQKLFLYNSNKGKFHTDMKLYKEICDLISNNSNEKYLKNCRNNTIESIIGIPSILTNYYIGNNSDLAIYRDKGLYTKESDSKYTHSATPLRRFVSNINLALYLNQLGIINCPDKYIYYIEDHLDEIITHLNEQEELKNEYEKKYYLLKKNNK